MNANHHGHMRREKRPVCFVTGTRAEFGLMVRALRAIREHPELELQIIATGMHLDPVRGSSVKEIEAAGLRVDEVVGWGGGGEETARQGGEGTRGGGPGVGGRGGLNVQLRTLKRQREEGGQESPGLGETTGVAMGGIALALEKLQSDVVLVVGDRVEAFAAAAAGHLAGRVVAHVHGGDRALGQVDDALRHAITKLAHVHFPATKLSAERIRRLGEQAWRIRRVGSPGVDGIVEDAAGWGDVVRWRSLNVEHRPLDIQRRGYALLVLHPADGDEEAEYRRAGLVLRAVLAAGVAGVVVVYPNNDPGSGGIVRCWEELVESRGVHGTGRQKDRARGLGFGVQILRNVPRGVFLGLMRHAAVMVGNSSSGIIEAGSFGTPVIDIGPRQEGRERGGNVRHVSYQAKAITAAVRAVWNGGRPRRVRGGNVYGGAHAGRRIAQTLAKLQIDRRLMRKIIAW
jgi:GDP/UDP-N,N'-diacetylbacillosamine 2-epimerase (hydrolysing)